MMICSLIEVKMTVINLITKKKIVKIFQKLKVMKIIIKNKKVITKLIQTQCITLHLKILPFLTYPKIFQLINNPDSNSEKVEDNNNSSN